MWHSYIFRKCCKFWHHTPLSCQKRCSKIQKIWHQNEAPYGQQISSHMHLSARSFFPILSTLHSSDRWIFHRIFPLNVISLENSPKPIWKCFVMDFVLPVYPTKYCRTQKKKWDAIVEFVSNLPCKNMIFPVLLFSSYGANAMTPVFWSQGKSGRRRTVCM